MTPIAFVPELHFETVRSWMEARGEAITLDALPQTGFIIPGKAAGFLYKTDSSVAMIEGLVAAPGVDREARDQAVDAIVQAVIAEAQRLGFKTLTGTTVLDAVVKRAERNGFVYVGGNFHVIIRPL